MKGMCDKECSVCVLLRSACVLIFIVLYLFCCFIGFLCFVVFCCYSFFGIFIFVCTSVGLLPPGESPIAVSK
jgi:hypothetical protein